MEELKFVIIGDGRIGKTCMLITFRDNKYPGDCVPTVFDSYLVELMVDSSPYFLSLWDTAGQDDYDSVRPLAYPLTDAFIVCFDISDPGSYRNVKEKWWPEISKTSAHVPLILVGTKQDLRPGEKVSEEHKDKVNTDSITYPQGLELANKIGAYKYMECSSATGLGVKRVFEEAVRATLYASREPKHSKHKWFNCVLL